MEQDFLDLLKTAEDYGLSPAWLLRLRGLSIYKYLQEKGRAKHRPELLPSITQAFQGLAVKLPYCYYIKRFIKLGRLDLIQNYPELRRNYYRCLWNEKKKEENRLKELSISTFQNMFMNYKGRKTKINLEDAIAFFRNPAWIGDRRRLYAPYILALRRYGLTPTEVRTLSLEEIKQRACYTYLKTVAEDPEKFIRALFYLNYPTIVQEGYTKLTYRGLRWWAIRIGFEQRKRAGLTFEEFKKDFLELVYLHINYRNIDREVCPSVSQELFRKRRELDVDLPSALLLVSAWDYGWRNILYLKGYELNGPLYYILRSKKVSSKDIDLALVESTTLEDYLKKLRSLIHNFEDFVYNSFHYWLVRYVHKHLPSAKLKFDHWNVCINGVWFDFSNPVEFKRQLVKFFTNS